MSLWVFFFFLGVFSLSGILELIDTPLYFSPFYLFMCFLSASFDWKNTNLLLSQLPAACLPVVSKWASSWIREIETRELWKTKQTKSVAKKPPFSFLPSSLIEHDLRASLPAWLTACLRWQIDPTAIRHLWLCLHDIAVESQLGKTNMI